MGSWSHQIQVWWETIVYYIIVPYFFFFLAWFITFTGKWNVGSFFSPHANKLCKLKWAGECGSLCYDLSPLFFHGYSPCLAAHFVLPGRPYMRQHALRLPTGWLWLGVVTANKMFALVLPHRIFGCKGKWVEVVLYRKGFFLMEKKRKIPVSTETEWVCFFKQCLYEWANERFW